MSPPEHKILLVLADDIFPFPQETELLMREYKGLLQEILSHSDDRDPAALDLNSAQIVGWQLGLSVLPSLFLKRHQVVGFLCDGSRKIKRLLITILLGLARAETRVLIFSRSNFQVLSFGGFARLLVASPLRSLRLLGLRVVFIVAIARGKAHSAEDR